MLILIPKVKQTGTVEQLIQEGMSKDKLQREAMKRRISFYQNLLLTCCDSEMIDSIKQLIDLDYDMTV